MHTHSNRTVSIVLYAKDARALARFYESVLGLSREQEDDGFVALGADGMEIAVIQAPAEVVGRFVLEVPPRPRTDSPMKASFAVADAESLRPAVEAAGGVLKPASAAWQWQGALHLDGWDPEGNVFQLRQPAEAGWPA